MTPSKGWLMDQRIPSRFGIVSPRGVAVMFKA